MFAQTEQACLVSFTDSLQCTEMYRRWIYSSLTPVATHMYILVLLHYAQQRPISSGFKAEKGWINALFNEYWSIYGFIVN